ncbi:MAG: dTDP-glucose 4,6-dehydratase, partial [Desulfobacterales bacterium CG07_land_8_20_14_0_80_52_14]
MKHGKKGETYNIGGNSEMENIRMVEMICDLVDERVGISVTGTRRGLITFVKDRPGHDRRYAVDFTKLKEELDWYPRESLSTGLKKTISWYLEHQDWVNRVRSGEYQKWIQEHYGIR